MNWLIKKINNYLFEPEYVSDLSLVRVVVVSVQLFFLVLSIFGIYFSNGANLDIQKWLVTINPHEFKPIYILKILLSPFGWGVRPDIMFLHFIWLLAIVTGFTSLLGMYKRLSLFLFAAANTILIAHAYSYTEQHHTEAVIIIFLWVLAFGENSRTWSVDNLRKRITISLSKMKFEPRDKYLTDEYSRWPIKLMQWLFVIIYLSAGLEKIKHGFNSYTLMYSFVLDQYTNGGILGLFLSEFPFILKIMAPLSIIFESTFFLVMFFPGITWIYVLFGSLFHTSIFIIQGPPFLHYIPLYIVFIEPLRNSWRKRFKKRIVEKPTWHIIYDGLCPLCLRTVTIVNYLDLRSKLKFINFEDEWQKVEKLNEQVKKDEAKHSMHLISPEGKVYKGFYAFRKLSGLLPLLWLFVPLIYFPFVNNLGNYIYKKVSAKRRDIVCNVEMCKLISKL